MLTKGPILVPVRRQRPRSLLLPCAWIECAFTIRPNKINRKQPQSTLRHWVATIHRFCIRYTEGKCTVELGRILETSPKVARLLQAIFALNKDSLRRGITCR